MNIKNPGLRKWLFVTDLDGTLLNDRRRVSQDDFTALESLRNMGCLTVVATGRSNYSLQRLLSRRDVLPLGSNSIPVDYFIFSTGAGIMSAADQRILQTAALSPGAVREIIEVLEHFRADYMIHRPVPHTREFLFRYHGSENPDFQARLKMYRRYGQPLTTSSFRQLDGATEVLCILPGGNAKSLASKLAQKLPQYSVIPATSPLDHKSVWIEIFAPTVSKSTALMWLTRELRIQVKNVCAVGNDYNDEDMLSWAGESFLVGNAPMSMKQRYRTVSTNNDNGVSQAVTEWLKGVISS